MKEKSAMTRKIHRLEQEVKQLQSRNTYLEAQIPQEQPTL